MSWSPVGHGSFAARAVELLGDPDTITAARAVLIEELLESLNV